jgi:hypothetical protein
MKDGGNCDMRKPWTSQIRFPIAVSSVILFMLTLSGCIDESTDEGKYQRIKQLEAKQGFLLKWFYSDEERRFMAKRQRELENELGSAKLEELREKEEKEMTERMYREAYRDALRRERELRDQRKVNQRNY